MEQACKSFNMEYRDERVFRGRVLAYRTYRNVYCFLCNKRKGTVAQPRCLTDVRGDTGRLLSGLPAITAVFDDRPDEVITTSKCMSDEIKEPILGSCKQLFCPLGETAVFGACRAYIQLVAVTLSTSYDVRFDQLGESDVSYEIIDGLLEKVKRKVQATFCDLCELVIYSRRLMVITATTSPQCTAKKLLKLHEFFSTQRTISFTLNKREYKASMKQSYVNMEEITGFGDYQMLPLNRILPCSQKIHLNPKFYCKRIEYSVDELINGGVPERTTDQLVNRSAHIDTEDDNGGHAKYVICMKDYALFKNQAVSLFSLLWLVISSGVIISF